MSNITLPAFRTDGQRRLSSKLQQERMGRRMKLLLLALILCGGCFDQTYPAPKVYHETLPGYKGLAYENWEVVERQERIEEKLDRLLKLLKEKP